MKKIINNIFFIFLGLFLYYLFIKYIVIRYMPFVLSFLITMLLTSYFKKKKKLGILTLFIIYLLTFLLMFYITFYGIKAFYYFITDLSYYYDIYIIPLINNMFDYLKFHELDFIFFVEEKHFSSLMIKILEYVINIFSKIPSFIHFYFLLIISSFMIYNGLDDLKEYVIDKISCTKIVEIKNIIMISLKNYIITQLEIGFIILIILLLAFYILGYKNAFILAIVTSVIDMIPLLGTGIVLIPIIIYYFLVNKVFKAIYIILIYVFINVIRTFLETKLMNNKMKLPGVILFISMIIHMELFGIPGIFISPISLSLFHTFLDKE